MSLHSLRTFSFLALVLLNSSSVFAQANDPQPQIRTYKTVGTTQLKAHVFAPLDSTPPRPHSAIILLHGGGWDLGDAEWMYGDAARYSGKGMVAIAGEYRLSDKKSVTPLDSMSDVRDLIRWVRENAADLHVNPAQIVVYGVSAGGHLAASAAVFPHPEESKISAVPDALILLSPALSLKGDAWVEKILIGRAAAKDISPADHIANPLPPFAIFEGAADTVTPLAGAQQFCNAMKQAGGTCDLHVYPNVGHLLTRNLDTRAQEQGPFDPDPADRADARAQQEAFLKKLGFLP